MPEPWTIGSFPFKLQPGVTQRQIRGFAELDFIPKAEDIVFVGPTGVGKTGLATGLLLKALQNGYRGLFVRAQDLFDEMYASLADRSSRKLLNRLARVDVLVIDEMGYLNLRPEQTNRTRLSAVVQSVPAGALPREFAHDIHENPIPELAARLRISRTQAYRRRTLGLAVLANAFRKLLK
jgi:DNA replication protein DnaC